MTNQDLYLPIELAKLIAPIARRVGVEEDGYWSISVSDFISVQGMAAYLGIADSKSGYIFTTSQLAAGSAAHYVPTYRKDKLEAMLPEWCFDGTMFNDYNNPDGIGAKMLRCSDHTSMLELFRTAQLSRGPASLTALAELILLLEKEKLL